MFDSLRRQLILSHVLPMLIVIPLMGIALIYVVETRVLLPSLSRDLVGQAMLLAEMAADDPGMFDRPDGPAVFVTRMDAFVEARLVVVDTSGRLLASTDPADASRVGTQLDLPDLSDALAGRVSARTTPHGRLGVTLDVLAPIVGAGGRVVGLIGLTRQLTSVYEQFLQLRYLIAGVLGLGLLLGAGVGWLLALNLARPLHQVTLTVDQLARGQELAALPEQGPEEVRLLLRAINTFIERVQVLERARSQLLANLVHELGRPLGGLRSAVQALEGGADEDPALRRELLRGMDAEIARLRRLLDDLARLHDQVVGDLELDHRAVALSAWLGPVLATYRLSAARKGLTWEADVPSDLPAIQADPDRLGQALGNLLTNAIKYTPAGGAVAFAAGQTPTEVWLRVGDTGPGIAEAEQALIFQPLYRSTRHRRFPQGMGLGLSIARDLIVAHGGRIEVDSTPGAGSRFTIWLPLPKGS
jgi:two-component system, OmpR family, sensor histidine kinase BaeS